MNYWFAAGIGYIAFWVGMSIGSIGDMPNISEPYSVDLPFSLFFLLVTPFGLGYIAGIESKDK